MNADYFVNVDVFYFFGAFMIAGATVIIAALTLRERFKRSRNTVD
jgi:hypothetical protein